MSQRLRNKVALITGAASGIGAGHAKIFALEGAKVAVCDVNADLGRTVAQQIRDQGGDAHFIGLDVTSEANWHEAVADTVGRFGVLTTLINNAGIYRPAGLDAETTEGWNSLISINQTGTWLGMKMAMPELLKSGNASIVNIGSIYGMTGSAGSIAYHASKGAGRMMSKSVALQYSRQGVRVNYVLPHLIKSALVDALPPDVIRTLEEAIPMGHGGVPEDVAFASVFLCSDEASYITGAELVIDGGFTAV